TTKPVGAGVVVLFIDSAYDQYWYYTSDFAVLQTVVSNALQFAGSTPVPIAPTNSASFVNGRWSGNIIVGQPATNVTLRADDGSGHYGLSLPFDVRPAPGQATHFAWNAIASPQSNGVPFAVTVTAQDYFNGPATNFTGTVALS